MKVAFLTLGCKVNFYETEKMEADFEANHVTVVPFKEKADVYIVNTCTVTNIADRKSRQMLHRARRLNPESIVVATGCYAESGKAQLEDDDTIDVVFANRDKASIASQVLDYVKEHRPSWKVEENGNDDMGSRENVHESSPVEERTRKYIKIQDGCNQFCSYCIIPYARGRVRSRQMEEILEEVRILAGNGYKEVVLTGIHISSYGLDLDGRTNVGKGEDFPCDRLLALISEIQKTEGIERIRLGSLEPRIITEKLAEGLAKMDKFCPHFHLSLQSGCDNVLERMNRKYTAGEYYDRVEILRRFFEDPAITTDVIVGFPGETEEEFAETERFLEKVEFYEMHVFKYSMRQGTVAAARKDQVPEDVKAARSDRLLALEQKQSAAYRERHLHKETSILFEEEKEIDGKRYQVGHSKEYIRAAFETEEEVSGQILRGQLTQLLKPDILLFTKM